MSRVKVAKWIEGDQFFHILKHFVDAADDGVEFPNYAEVPIYRIRPIMNQEMHALAAYLAEDDAALDKAKADQRRIYHVSADIPLEEQVRCLKRRHELLLELMAEDPQVAGDVDALRPVLDEAEVYFRSQIEAMHAAASAEET